MNNNLCQFYVVFSNKNFVSPNNNNVYISANNINNLKELSDKIIATYKEKSKAGIKVGSEIIFLIPNEKYRQKTLDIIKQLKVNGKIEVMDAVKTKTPETFSGPLPPPPLEMKNPTEKIEKPILANSIPNELNKIEEKNISNEIVLNKEETKEEIKIEDTSIDKKADDKTNIYQPNDNIYRGTIGSGTYTTLNQEKKKNNLALIIFVISFIFFIISLILLFVM